MTSAISTFVPRPRLREVDRIAVDASPAKAWAVVRTADLYRLGLVRSLFRARTLPDRLSARAHGKPPPIFPRSAHLDEIVAPGSGFHLLADRPGEEFVAGAIGKFWETSIPFVDITPESFASYDTPGFGKVAWSLQVHDRVGGGSWIAVDLRVDATDDAAWREFGPYWKLIGRFSHWIRRSMLRDLTRTLGAPESDDTRTLPGDDVLPTARASSTMSIDIEAPTDRVWPWLVQMGCRRAGWYSIDRLDNGGRPSADRVVDDLQHIAVGDILPATPKGDDGFAVLRVEPNRLLVLGSPSLLSSESQKNASWHMPGADYDATWSFVLDPIGDEATRLITRVRAEFEPGISMAVAKPAILSVHHLMENAQLHNIKRRVERSISA